MGTDEDEGSGSVMDILKGYKRRVCTRVCLHTQCTSGSLQASKSRVAQIVILTRRPVSTRYIFVKFLIRLSNYALRSCEHCCPLLGHMSGAHSISACIMRRPYTPCILDPGKSATRDTISCLTAIYVRYFLHVR